MNDIVLNFYGFSRYPFLKNISCKNHFISESYKQAQGFLGLGIRSEDIMLVSGEVGIGKSAALRSFYSSVDTNTYLPVYIRGTNLSSTDLYKLLLEAMQIMPPHFGDKAKRLYFKAVAEMSKKPVAIIDDAQELKDSAIDGLKAMVNFDCDSKNKITFILSGQPELIQRIKLAQFYSLRQRIKLSFAMQAMTLEETCRYIDHHTRICDNPNSIFSDSAKSAIFKRSRGIARIINSICYNAIAYGAANKLEIIDSSNLVFGALIDD